jgi:hypothetical protein
MKKLSYLISLLTLLSLSSCSTSSPKKVDSKLVTNAALVPAAQGQVQTNVDRNGNTTIDVQVKHLADPGAISPGANGYVAWVLPTGTEAYQNIGTLKVNKNLDGRLSTSVPYKSFRLIITPESNTMAQRPTGATVLEKAVNI